MRIGTRGSDLALAQARYVQSLFADRGIAATIEIIKTRGDRIQDVPLSAVADERKGFFTREIEEALLGGQIDVAVHSYKDLPTAGVEGLTVAAIPERQNPAEILLIRKECQRLKELPFLAAGQILGTSSERRKAEILWHWPGLIVHDLRGNVPTRIARLREGSFDGILLAEAGLGRLRASGAVTRKDLDGLLLAELPPASFPAAPAQGALALQCRSDDRATLAALAQLHRSDLSLTVDAERAVLTGLQGGCHLPLGIHIQAEKSYFKGHLFLGENARENRTGRSFLIERRARTPAELAHLFLIELKEKPAIVLTGREDRIRELVLPRKIILPLIETEPLPADPAILARWLDAAPPHFIALFSVPAFTALCRLCPARILEQANFLVTGRATRRAIEGAFPAAKIVAQSVNGTARDLAMHFKKEFPGSAAILVPRASEGRTDFQEELSDRSIFEWEVYQTRERLASATELSRLPEGAVVVLSSPSAVKAWISSFKASGLPLPHTAIYACLGPTTASEMEHQGLLPNLVARQANYESLLSEPCFAP